MQIRELVLYGYNGKVRHLVFELGKVNIITGKSKSGKSVVGDIIEYCMGGNSCNIADGVVRDTVAWYGLLLQFETERIFVARKNPGKDHQTTMDCYYEIGEKLEVPIKCDFSTNTNVSGIEEMLTRKIGISENLNKPPKGQSRNALSANIRHALYYCFQGQDEIASKNFLFHRQSDDFITQAIKDTIPYFLGAVSEEALVLENERSKLKSKLKNEERKYSENNNLKGEGSIRGITLIGEARQVGLISDSVKINYNDHQELLTTLNEVLKWSPSIISSDDGMDRLLTLQSNLEKARNEYDDIEFKLKNAKEFSFETNGYYKEATHQKKRLESIGLFEKLNFNNERCPFCSAKLEHPNPSVEMIKHSIINLDKSIKNVTRQNPRLLNYISSLEKERHDKLKVIRSIEAEINGLYKHKDELACIRDLNTQRGKVVGRISLWMESLSNDIEDEQQIQTIKKLEDRIKEIDSFLSQELIEDRKRSALSRIQEDMTEWAKSLNLEYTGNPYRLDLNKATVIVDKIERPVPLKQLGSGSNWVGVHLITYFALQKYFINANRPVPSFMFLDQPSQVYFPSESGKNGKDWEEVKRIYRFINKRTSELNGNLQVIIVDHANFDQDYFRNCICEDWSDSISLIPNDWYEK